MKNISNIRFLTTPLNWFRGFLYTFIWRPTPHVYQSISHGKDVFFSLEKSLCDPQIRDETDPIRVKVHASVLTFLPNSFGTPLTKNHMTNRFQSSSTNGHGHTNHQRFSPISNLSTRTGNGCPLCISTCPNLKIADDLAWAAKAQIPKYQRWRHGFYPRHQNVKLQFRKQQTGKSGPMSWKVPWLQSSFEGVYKNLKRTLITTIPIFLRAVITVFWKRTLIYSH